jgi:hypothetical protein
MRSLVAMRSGRCSFFHRELSPPLFRVERALRGLVALPELGVHPQDEPQHRRRGSFGDLALGADQRHQPAVRAPVDDPELE